MVTRTFIGNMNELREVFNEYFAENPNLHKDKFEEFLSFLQIDYYDWVRENLKQFNINQD